ncbi:MAG: primosomal protein N' [Planctomycetaceae bacterium]|nr:primosomal protein N' [Planctomycetaceae bacterium]|tara:strand:+ start:3506 stop:5836 length:2331 start_codon:yes stop_codon:yes gene_type:complete
MDRQQGLFEDDAFEMPQHPAPWEVDAARDRSLATVVFSEVPWGPFDYLIPDALRAEVQVGRRVEVPLGRGNRIVIGYCVAIHHETGEFKSDYKMKPVAAVLDRTTLVCPRMLELTNWMSDYYLARPGQVLEALIPAGVRSLAGTRAVKFYALNPTNLTTIDIEKLPAKQQRIVEVLKGQKVWLTGDQICKQVGCTQAPLRSLTNKRLLQVEKRRIYKHDIQQEVLEREQALTLNQDQRRALDSITSAVKQDQHKTILMHGITGSGKTEVYIQAIEEVISYGRQAIVLVPEISLTPQTRQRFRSRFDSVAVLHSHLSDAERHWHWQQIANGEVQVVVGARSAIFAPTARLGLIVLDEEHETSFKQETTPRYHARDVAVKRAQLQNIPLVLGSATPALETWHKAKTGEYELVSLPERVMNRPLPAVATVDLRHEGRSKQSYGSISRQLSTAIDQTIRDDGQIILLLNRRGYSTNIQCPACGFVLECPQCEISLTHHRYGISGQRRELALCHYCDYQMTAPKRCPDCGGDAIRFGGLGTQRLEEEVKNRFPGVSVLRMDSDTMQRPNSHEQALDSFRNGEVKILVGTQMIAKGLDFPNVMLVGVINADTALHFPDFRAGERTFQLVTQVAGRTGRGEVEGRVLVQTYTPEHLAIQAATKHEYEMFAERELPGREQFGYPPFTKMIRLIIRGVDQAATMAYAGDLVQHCKENLAGREDEVRILGPATAPIGKLRDRYRIHVLLISTDGELLRKAVSKVYEHARPVEGIQWVVDVDPLSML